MTELERYRTETAGLAAPDLLRWARSTFGQQGVTFASSLGAEDQVITHLLAEHAADIPVFTLDTGRLHQETYDLLHRTRVRYALDIAIYFPDARQVEEMVREGGPNLFYDSQANRKRCCHVRKVAPLGRALAGRRAWICGLRRGQSGTRGEIQLVDWDDANGLYRIAPLADWSEEQVWRFIREHDVPYNELHDHGYPSIGCAPCTRAVNPGDDPRSGRWWWELPEHRECGLHTADRAAGAPGRFGITTINPGH